MNFHKLLDAKAFERRYYRLELLLDENSIEAILVADGFEYVELDK